MDDIDTGVCPPPSTCQPMAPIGLLVRLDALVRVPVRVLLSRDRADFTGPFSGPRWKL